MTSINNKRSKMIVYVPYNENPFLLCRCIVNFFVALGFWYENIAADISRGTLRKRHASTQRAIEPGRERSRKIQTVQEGKREEERERKKERERERERNRESLRESGPARATPVRVTHFCGDERGCTVEMSIKRVGQWASPMWRHCRGIGQSGGADDVTGEDGNNPTPTRDEKPQAFLFLGGPLERGVGRQGGAREWRLSGVARGTEEGRREENGWGGGCGNARRCGCRGESPVAAQASPNMGLLIPRNNGNCPMQNGDR